MASIAPQTFPPPSSRTEMNPHKLTFANSKFSSPGLKGASSSFRSHYLSSHSLSRTSFSDSTSCRCNNNNNNSAAGDSSDDGSSSTPTVRWDSAMQDAFWRAFKKLDDMRNAFLNWNREKSVGLSGREGWSEVKEGAGYGGGDVEEWDWEQWRKHFSDVDEQERIVSILKSQLAAAINSEDYKEAARLKVAIASAATNDTISKVMSHMHGGTYILELCRKSGMRMQLFYVIMLVLDWWDGGQVFQKILMILMVVSYAYVLSMGDMWQGVIVRGSLFRLWMVHHCLRYSLP